MVDERSVKVVSRGRALGGLDNTTVTDLARSASCIPEKIEELDVADNGLGNLKGLGRFRSLKSLNASHNSIDSLPKSVPVHLTKVNFAYNQLRSLLGFEELPHLIYLDISFNVLDTTKGLSCNTKLRVVKAAGNRIRRVEELEGLVSLESLDLRKNLIERVQDLSSLQVNYNLKRLQVEGNESLNTPHLRGDVAMLLPFLRALDNWQIVSEKQRRDMAARKILQNNQQSFAMLAQSVVNDSVMRPGDSHYGPPSSQAIPGHPHVHHYATPLSAQLVPPYNGTGQPQHQPPPNAAVAPPPGVAQTPVYLEDSLDFERLDNPSRMYLRAGGNGQDDTITEGGHMRVPVDQSLQQRPEWDNRVRSTPVSHKQPWPHSRPRPKDVDPEENRADKRYPIHFPDQVLAPSQHTARSRSRSRSPRSDDHVVTEVEVSPRRDLSEQHNFNKRHYYSERQGWAAGTPSSYWHHEQAPSIHDDDAESVRSGFSFEIPSLQGTVPRATPRLTSTRKWLQHRAHHSPKRDRLKYLVKENEKMEAMASYQTRWAAQQHMLATMSMERDGLAKRTLQAEQYHTNEALKYHGEHEMLQNRLRNASGSIRDAVEQKKSLLDRSNRPPSKIKAILEQTIQDKKSRLEQRSAPTSPVRRHSPSPPRPTSPPTHHDSRPPTYTPRQQSPPRARTPVSTQRQTDKKEKSKEERGRGMHLARTKLQRTPKKEKPDLMSEVRKLQSTRDVGEIARILDHARNLSPRQKSELDRWALERIQFVQRMHAEIKQAVTPLKDALDSVKEDAAAVRAEDHAIEQRAQGRLSPTPIHSPPPRAVTQQRDPVPRTPPPQRFMSENRPLTPAERRAKGIEVAKRTYEEHKSRNMFKTRATPSPAARASMGLKDPPPARLGSSQTRPFRRSLTPELELKAREMRWDDRFHVDSK